MNVVIIEDENLTAKRLESLLHKYDPAITVLNQIPSVAEAVAWFKEPHPPWNWCSWTFTSKMTWVFAFLNKHP
jgi:hypothetical protein